MDTTYYADVMDYQRNVLETVEGTSVVGTHLNAKAWAEWHYDAYSYDMYRQTPDEGSVLIMHKEL